MLSSVGLRCQAILIFKSVAFRRGKSFSARNKNMEVSIMSVKNLAEKKIKSAGSFVFAFIKWIIVALITGTAGGLIGSVFHLSIELVTDLRAQLPALLFLMPAGGIIIVFLYRLLKFPVDPGTNLVLTSVRSEKDGVPMRILPLIFVSTVISQLVGASTGREGAAIQMGGSLATELGKLLRLKEKSVPIVMICGMSAVFAALFGTPLTAALFAMEVISVGIMYYSALFPSFLAALIATWISKIFGISPIRFELVSQIQLNIPNLLRSAGIGLCCAVVSILFCYALKYSRIWISKLIKNPYLRITAGSVFLIALTLILGTERYNGAGFETVSEIINTGQAKYFDFVLKLLFTSVSIAVGFKGGEIIPTFFIGASLGCTVGTLLGLDPSFAAALGLAALFCAMVNSPITAVVLSIEVFGAANLPMFASAIFVSYTLSGYYGLYSDQKIIYSKLLAEHIGIKAK